MAWSASEGGKLFQTDTVWGMKENCEAVVRAKGWCAYGQSLDGGWVWLDASFDYAVSVFFYSLYVKNYYLHVN